MEQGKRVVIIQLRSGRLDRARACVGTAQYRVLPDFL